MTDDRSPIDDELVSAVLDGEATAEERALVEGSVEGRRRLGELRAVAQRVAVPPPALDPVRVDALVGRALDAAEAGSPGPVPDQLAERRGRVPVNRGPWRRAVTAAAAAVAAVVLVGGLALLAGRSQSHQAADSASDSQAGGSAVSTDASGSEESSSSGLAADVAMPPPVDVGPLPDAAAVLSGYAAIETDPGLRSRSEPDDGTAPVPSTVTGSTCAVPPPTALPGETWSLVAVAELPTGPVLVLADTASGPLGRVLVVDATSCAVLAERSP